MTKLIQRGFCGALAEGVLTTSLHAPDAARPMFRERAARWTDAANDSTLSMAITRLQGVEIRPDDSGQTSEELRRAFAPGGVATGHCEPAGVFRLIVRGELLDVPDSFAEHVARCRAVRLTIDSSGGDCGAALEMTHALRASGKPVHARAGLAASAAAILLQAGTRRTIRPDGHLLLHPPRMAGFGSARVLRAIAEHTERVNEGVIALFVERSGQARSEVEQWFSGPDVWLDAPAALSLGLVDEIVT